MMQLALGWSGQELRTLLCLGAHCDDIEIGCGGTVLRLAKQHSELRVHWVVLSSSPERAREAREGAERFLGNVGHKEVVIKEFRTSFFPYIGGQIKEFFEDLKGQVAPDLVLTHTGHDLHQDHRVTCELTWNTFRDHFILEYEIPKYDGDLNGPNFFVPLDAEHYHTKVEHLLKCFPSQREKSWFTRETFLALMRLRGIECNAPSGYAEGFYCRKALVAPGRAYK
jgi:LmbE family N-acetylglucosaminyl deacetylase